MFKSLMTSMAVLALSVAPVSAMTQEERNQHTDLVDALSEVNITISVNEKEHCFSLTDRFYGFYNPSKRLIAICQEKAQEWNGEVIRFSEEDLDTLRHEAHHLVQDCRDGKIDGRMVPFFTGESRESFLSNYPKREQERVRATYGESGGSPELITLEIEAFAVAETVGADSIANAVRRVCAPE
jgi:hypothetical protein